MSIKTSMDGTGNPMDELIESAGKFGKFQYKVLVLIGFISALTSGCIFATIFIAGEPELKCFYNKSAVDANQSVVQVYVEACDIWSNMSSHERLQKRHKQYECYFDQTLYNRTIISDWNLVCDRYYLAGLTQTIQIFGSIFGFFGGIFGDRYGRKRSTIAFSFLLSATLLITQALLSNPLFDLPIMAKYIVYSVSQFLIGLLVNCLYCTAYVLLMEYTTAKYRTIVANLNSYFYVGGQILVFVVYYFARNWSVLNWFIVIYSMVLSVLVAFFLKESPAWLITCNRHEEAHSILSKIARQNGIKNYSIPRMSISLIKNEEEMLREGLLGNTNLENEKNPFSSTETSDLGEQKPDLESSQDTDEQATGFCGVLSDIKADIMMFKYLFTPREYFIRTCLLFYLWAALMLLYYGISLGVTSVDLVDPYLMYFLSAIAEMIGYILCYVNDVFGRKRTTLGFLIATAIMYSLIAFLSSDEGHLAPALPNLVNNSTDSGLSSAEPTERIPAKAIYIMVFALIGKCAVSGLYNLAYIYTSELYPIKTRNTAILFLTCFGGASSLVSPQINLLKSHVWNPLPYIIYAISALIAVVCVMYLPETKVLKKSKKKTKIALK